MYHRIVIDGGLTCLTFFSFVLSLGGCRSCDRCAPVDVFLVCMVMSLFFFTSSFFSFFPLFWGSYGCGRYYFPVYAGGRD